MLYKYLLAIDPSGSFIEGKGTTGWCVFNCTENKVTIAHSLKAKEHGKMELYWDAHIQLIKDFQKRYGKDLIVIIEDYILYEHKMKDQINSRMETCKVIGIIQHYCYLQGLPYCMQLAATVKNRWTNDILGYKKYVFKKSRSYCLSDRKTILDRHALDSIRHAVHFATFKNGG